MILGAVVFIWKLWIASFANPIWEEAHFVVSGRHLALGYPDIPAGFAWLSRLVPFSESLFALRFFALIIATLIPVSVWFMARGFLNPRLSLWAALLAIILPPLSVSGTIYYPEGLLQVLTALMLGCLIRSQSDDGWKWWLWTGVCGAVGLFIHYRFLGVGLGIIAYALISPEGRNLWFRPQFWAAGGIALIGMVPAVIYNASHDWPAIAFHLKNRPDWRPNSGLLGSFLSQQIGLVTPVFFVVMVGTVWRILRRGATESETLLASVSATIFLTYFIQAPANHMLYPHWPFMAYVGGVALLPSALIDWSDGATSRLKRLGIEALIGLGPVMAVAIGIGLSLYEYAFAHSANIPYTGRQMNVMKNEDYRLALKPIQAQLEAAKTDILVTSDHILALRLAYPHNREINFSDQIYTLDSPEDVATRFSTARADWKLGPQALMTTQAEKVAVIVLPEPTYLYHTSEDTTFRESVCQRFDDLIKTGTITLPPGKVELGLYRGRVRSSLKAVSLCAALPDLYLAQPRRGAFIRPNKENYFGIAADAKGITRLEVLIDGKALTEARLHLDLDSFHAPKILSYDPDYPKIQFDFNLRDVAIAKGEHHLSLRAIMKDGSQKTGAERVVYR